MNLMTFTQGISFYTKIVLLNEKIEKEQMKRKINKNT